MSAYTAKTAMLSGIIDYAGTFPPAALSLENALKQNLEYKRKAKHPWLWSKVVLSLKDIKSIGPKMLFDAGFDGHPLIVSVLASPFEGNSVLDLVKHVEWDLRELEHCKKRATDSSAKQIFTAYEIALPIELELKEAIPALLNRVSEIVQLDPYFEIPFGDTFEKNLRLLTENLSDWKEDNDESDCKPGIKVRTGGKYVPTSAQISRTILAATTHRLKYKATQGLHHALSSSKAIGFVNLFSALNLAQAYGEMEFGLDKVQACLEETNRKNFQFYENLFKYKNFELSCDDIEKARRVHAATFGSCSLDEPDQFLLEEL